VGYESGRRAGWCSTGRCPGGAIASRVGGHRVCWVPHTRRTARWADPHGSDRCALPWGATASPRRPHSTASRYPGYAGKAHDLPWLLDDNTRRLGAWPRPARGDTQGGGLAERFKTPLVGGAARLWRRGGNPPAPAFPRRGKRERGRFKFLAAAG